MRVPDLKSMPKFRPLPPIASAPIKRMQPDSEKNHFEAPMKSNVHSRLGLPAPSAQEWLISRVRPIVPSAARVASTAVNRVSSVPIPSMNANPLTSAVASANRMNAVMNVTTFASTIAANPRVYPVAIPDTIERPPLISSLTRSNMTMFASAAMPIVRITPAIPGSVSVTGISLISAKKYAP